MVNFYYKKDKEIVITKTPKNKKNTHTQNFNAFDVKKKKRKEIPISMKLF